MFNQTHARMAEAQMTHLNRNMLCAIYIETTGDNPEIHEIVQICAWIVDAFIKPSETYHPFYMDIQPLNPEEIDFDTASLSKQKLLTAALNGLSPSIVADRFGEWVEGTNIADQKKIVPLCYNWPEVRPFIIKWLGHYNFHSIFDREYRDIMQVAMHLNDRCNFRAEPCYYPKTVISYIGNQHNVDIDSKIEVMEKCLKIADIYRAMLSRRY